MQGAGAETSCWDASAGGWLKKSNRRRGVVVAPVLTKKDKPSGSRTRAFAVGERILPSFLEGRAQEGRSSSGPESLITNESAVS